MEKRPLSLKLAALIIWVEAGISLMGAVLAALMGTTFMASIGVVNFTELLFSVSAVAIIISIAMIFVGIFLWAKNKYAWWIAFILSALSLIGSLLGLMSISAMTFIGIVIAFVLVYLLWYKDTRTACKIKF